MTASMPAQATSNKREIHDANGALKCIAITTPNTMAIMYVMRSKSMNNRTLSFKSREQAQKASPNLVALLMTAFPDISRVAMGTNPQGYDYMTVTVRAPDAWQKDDMRTKAEEMIVKLVDHINRHPVEKLIDFTQFPKAKTPDEYSKAFQRAGCSFWEAQHRTAIAMVNNALIHDGGEVHFAGYDEKSQTLKIWLDGNCKNCRASSLTVEFNLKNFFKNNADMLEKKVQNLQVVQEQPVLVAPRFA